MPGARPVMVNTTGPSALAVRSRATYSALVLPSGSERVRKRKVPLSAVPAITGRTAMRPAARAVLSSRLRPARVLMESLLPVPPFRFRAAPRIYRLQSWDPKVADGEAPGFPPDATSFRIEWMRMADFCRECSCRSGRTPCGARDWLRLETAIPSAPSHTPRLGVVEPVCCDLHLDLYIRSLDAHGVSRNAAWGWRPEHCAGLDVVDGPMPRARDLLARHLALRERAATVGAGVVDGVEAPLQVEESDLLPRHLDALRRAWSEVGGARDLGELRHVNLLATRWWGTIGRWHRSLAPPGRTGLRPA